MISTKSSGTKNLYVWKKLGEMRLWIRTRTSKGESHTDYKYFHIWYRQNCCFIYCIVILFAYLINFHPLFFWLQGVCSSMWPITRSECQTDQIRSTRLSWWFSPQLQEYGSQPVCTHAGKGELIYPCVIVKYTKILSVGFFNTVTAWVLL